MNGCLSDEELAGYRGGGMGEEQSAWVEAHLSACSACARRDAEGARSGRRLAGDLRDLGKAGLDGLNASPAGGPPADGAALDVGAGAKAGFQIEGYEVVRELHRGGQGVVYQAVQKHTKRKVAIKVLLEGVHASPSAKRRFEREIELAAQLKHANIIAIFQSGLTSDGRQFCAMDYVRGLRLDEYVAEKKPSVEDLLSLFATICDAVMYAHQRGIIHRDLKPSNILVDAGGEPKVLDFGLASAHHNLADVCQDRGRIDESRDHYRQALQIREALLAEKPKNKTRRLQVVTLRRRLAGLSAMEGAFQDALAEYGRTVALCEAVVEDHPDDPDSTRQLAICYERLAYAETTLGETAKAIATRRRSVELTKGLADTDPTNATWRLDWARCLHGLANLEFTAGHHDEAIASHRLALEVRQSLSDADPRNSRLRKSVGNSHSSLASALCDVRLAGGHDERLDEAKSHHQAALEAFERAALTEPGDVYLIKSQANALNAIGHILHRQGSIEDALRHHRMALALLETLCAANAEFKQGHIALGHVLVAIGSIRTEQGRYDEALALIQRAIAIHEPLSEAEPDDMHTRVQLCAAIYAKARVYKAQGDILRSMATFAKAIQMGYTISLSDPDGRFGRLDLELKRQLRRLMRDIADSMRSGKTKKAEKNDKPARKGSTQPSG